MRKIPLYPSLQAPSEQDAWGREFDNPVIEGPMADYRPIVPLSPTERLRWEQEGGVAEREGKLRDALAAYIRGGIRHRLRALGWIILETEARTMQARDAFLAVGDMQGLLAAGLQCIDREFWEEGIEILTFVRSSEYLRRIAHLLRNRDPDVAAAATAAADAIDATRA